MFGPSLRIDYGSVEPDMLQSDYPCVVMGTSTSARIVKPPFKALLSPATTSGLVKECKMALNNLGQSYSIALVWVPGHKLAKLVLRSKYLAAQCHVPIPNSAYKQVINGWLASKHAQCWNTYLGEVLTTYQKFPFQTGSQMQQGLTSSREETDSQSGAITGHCGLKKHFCTIGLSQDPRCDCDLRTKLAFMLYMNVLDFRL